MVTFTINIPQMLAYIPYMDPMGIVIPECAFFCTWVPKVLPECNTWVSLIL